MNKIFYTYWFLISLLLLIYETTTGVGFTITSLVCICLSNLPKKHRKMSESESQDFINRMEEEEISREEDVYHAVQQEDDYLYYGRK